MLVISKKTFAKNGKPNPVHTFDAGLSTMNLMLQATAMGLIAHGMAGFDRDKTRADLQFSHDYEPEAMIAIGWPGDPDRLPKEMAAMEVPTGRKKIAEFAREGVFDF